MRTRLEDALIVFYLIMLLLLCIPLIIYPSIPYSHGTKKLYSSRNTAIVLCCERHDDKHYYLNFRFEYFFLFYNDNMNEFVEMIHH